jgi:hypothetical protein
MAKLVSMHASRFSVDCGRSSIFVYRNTDTATFDSADLSDIDIGNGEPVAVVQEAKYLGSYATSTRRDEYARRERAPTSGT